MKTKSEIFEYLEDGFLNCFLSKLYENYKPTTIESDFDYKIEIIIIEENEYKRLTNFPPVNFNFYENYRCGCDHDCCGCMSSISVTVKNNKNGFITIFINSSFNY